MKTLMIHTHEAWLEMLMTGFMSESKNRQIFLDFSDILFRHFTWIEHAVIEADISYSYDREAIPIRVENLADMIQAITLKLQTIVSNLSILTDTDLSERIHTDIEYMITVLATIPNERVNAFNMERKLNGVILTQEATDALTLFLFEETYKEYELILIYNYLKAHSSDAYLNRIFQILIDESFFHLKRFGDMGAEMGILAVPRSVMKEVYQVEDIVTFLKGGIEEELNAKEECVKLSKAVGDESPELAKFFDFINHQENYHIALMKDALNYFTGKEHE